MRLRTETRFIIDVKNKISMYEAICSYYDAHSDYTQQALDNLILTGRKIAMFLIEKGYPPRVVHRRGIRMQKHIYHYLWWNGQQIPLAMNERTLEFMKKTLGRYYDEDK